MADMNLDCLFNDDANGSWDSRHHLWSVSSGRVITALAALVEHLKTEHPKEYEKLSLMFLAADVDAD